MRTIGLIGGMTWESSAVYYRIVNEAVHERLGGHHNAESVMVTVDFARIAAMQEAGDWNASGRLLADAATRLEAAGADLVALCTNTMHLVSDAIEAATSVPFIHLVDVTAASVRDAGLQRVGLLGTRYTMESDFYRDRMAGHGITTITPEPGERELVHRVIYDELAHGTIRDESRDAYRRVMANLAARGCEGIILGCTEIPLLVGADDSPAPVFDSTRLHAERLVDLALA